MHIDSQKIKQNGWKQGACFSIDKPTKIYIYSPSHHVRNFLLNGLYVVLSHDCDILNMDLQKEPTVEIIQVNKISKCCHEFTSGKNPRKLHIEGVGGDYCLEFLPYQRFFIEKTYLERLEVNSIEISGKLLYVHNLFKKSS